MSASALAWLLNQLNDNRMFSRLEYTPVACITGAPLPLLPPAHELVETMPILCQESRAASASAELKGLSRFVLPNPAILINALVLKEAKASSAIENTITTDAKLYQALTVKGQDIDHLVYGLRSPY